MRRRSRSTNAPPAPCSIASLCLAAGLSAGCAVPYAPYPEPQAAYVRPGLIGDAILNPPSISIRRVQTPGRCAEPVALSFFAPKGNPPLVGTTAPPLGQGQPEFLIAPGLHEFNVNLSAGVTACSIAGTVDLVRGERQEVIAVFSAQRRSCHLVVRRWRDGEWRPEPPLAASC
jgi:hypothetical protein